MAKRSVPVSNWCKVDLSSALYFLLGVIVSVGLLIMTDLPFATMPQPVCKSKATASDAAAQCNSSVVDGGALEPYIHALPVDTMFAASSVPQYEITSYWTKNDGPLADVADEPDALGPIHRLYEIPRTVVDDACRPYAKYLLFNNRVGQLNNQLNTFRNALMLGRMLQMVVVLPEIDNDKHTFHLLTPFGNYYDMGLLRKMFNVIPMSEFKEKVLPTLPPVESVELLDVTSAVARKKLHIHLVGYEGYNENNEVRHTASSTQLYEKELGMKISGFKVLRFRTLADYALKRPCAFNTLSRIITFHRFFIFFPDHWFEFLCKELYFCDMQAELTRHIRPRAEYMRVVNKLQEQLPGKQLSVHVRTMEYGQCVRIFSRVHQNDSRRSNETVVMRFCHPSGDALIQMLHRRGVLRDVDSVFFAHDGSSAEWLAEMQTALSRYSKSTDSLLDAAAPEKDRVVFRSSPTQDEVESIWKEVNKDETDMPLEGTGRYLLPVIDFELAARGKWILGNSVSSASKMIIEVAEHAYDLPSSHVLYYHWANPGVDDSDLVGQ